MTKIKITKQELKTLFETSKNISDNFKDIRKMLISQPRMDFLKESETLSHTAARKLIYGIMLKKLFPQSKLILISKNNLDVLAFSILSEVFTDIY